MQEKKNKEISDPLNCSNSCFSKATYFLENPPLKIRIGSIIAVECELVFDPDNTKVHHVVTDLVLRYVQFI